MNNASRARYSSLNRLRPLSFQPRHNSPLRTFSSTAIRPADTPDTVPVTSAEDIESVVRQARQTFGETLPKDYLSTEEYIVYERLYGPPLRATTAEDLEYLPREEEEEFDEDLVRNVLLRELPDGEFEEVEFDPALGFNVTADPEVAAAALEGENSLVEEGEIAEVGDAELTLIDIDEAEHADEPVVQVQAQNQREIDVIIRLQKDMDAAMKRAVDAEEEEILDEVEEEEPTEEEEDEYDEEEPDMYVTSDEVRTHPHTMTGRFGTSPSTVYLPKEQFVEPISELLERTNMKHLIEASEKAFGGKGLPHSPSTPESRKLAPQKHIGLDASQHRMSNVEADAFLAGVMPQTYASVMSTLVEVRKRLGSNWVRDMIFREGGEGPRVLDAGAGGAGLIAWKEILQAEWDVLIEEGLVEGETAPSGKTTVLTGPDTLRHRMSRFLENTTFIPRLPDYVHSSNSEALLDGSPAQPRKSYDLIIAPHLLFPLKEDYRRKNMVENLWSLLDPNGGVLILLEKGLPRGFEAIAGARSLLLESHISSPGDTSIENETLSAASEGSRYTEKEEGMIIAPCTNHTKCPMYPVPGMSTGRKDFCHFSQRFIRPPFLQRVLGATAVNHEDIKFSYIAVRRGKDARKANDALLQGDAATDQSFAGYEEHDLPDSEEASDVKFQALSLPRSILPPLKRTGHVTFDVCTPSGTLERWTVPKSFSKAAYRDARKSKWGDLWALGAKTRTVRTPRLGKKDDLKLNKKKIKAGKIAPMNRDKKKKNKLVIVMGKKGMEGIEEDKNSTRIFRPEKRTKGGRVLKDKKPIGEDDL